MFHPQSNFYSQGIGFPQSFGSPGLGIPIGYPQPTPGFAYGLPQITSWQPPAPQLAQHQAQQQAALQQQALLHLLANQYSQPFTAQPLQGANGFAAAANGAAQPTSAWQQPQINPEQINPALLPQSQQQLLQRLAQYHYLVAQQLTQMAAQQATQGAGTPYAGQFIPSQLGTSFVPGFTMH